MKLGVFWKFEDTSSYSVAFLGFQSPKKNRKMRLEMDLNIGI